MKFFFCENCGKRLTDEQIDKGEAKNKKLRGVYCIDCSAGIMTMETLPLSEQQAADILGVKSDSAPPPTPARRRSSEQKIMPAHGSRSADRRGRGRGTTAGPLPVILASAGAAIFLIAALVLLSGKGTPPPHAATSRPDPVPSWTPAMRTTPDLATATTEPSPTPVGPEEPTPPDLPAYSETPETSVVPDTPATPATPVPPKPAPAPQAAPPAQPAPAQWKETLGVEMLQYLSDSNFTGARAALEKAAPDYAAAGLAERLEAERAALGWVEEVQQAVLAGADLLKDGRAFTLKIGSKSIELGPGKFDRVRGVQDGVLELEHAEGAVSFSQKLFLNEWPAATRLELAALALAGKPLAEAKLAYMQCVQALGKGLPPAETLSALQAGMARLKPVLEGEAALTGAQRALLRERLALFESRLAGMEEQALWAQVEARMKDAKWKEAQAALGDWEARYQATPYFVPRAAHVAALRERLVEELEAQRIAQARGNKTPALHLPLDSYEKEIVSKEYPGVKAILHGLFEEKSHFGGGLRIGTKPKFGEGIILNVPERFFEHGGTIEFWARFGEAYRAHLIRLTKQDVGIAFGSAAIKDAAPVNTWAHFAFVMEKGKYTWYINGKPKIERNTTVEWRAVTLVEMGASGIGVYNAYPDGASGILDNLKVWQFPVTVFDLNRP